MLISRNISKALGDITKGHFHKRGRGHQHYFWLDGCKRRAFLEISRSCFFFFFGRLFVQRLLGLERKDPKICRKCGTCNCVRPCIQFRKSELFYWFVSVGWERRSSRSVSHSEVFARANFSRRPSVCVRDSGYRFGSPVAAWAVQAGRGRGAAVR